MAPYVTTLNFHDISNVHMQVRNWRYEDSPLRRRYMKVPSNRAQKLGSESALLEMGKLSYVMLVLSRRIGTKDAVNGKTATVPMTPYATTLNFHDISNVHVQ
ncbi:unnamed protein product, partial [Nesidiocoris tenuis]